MKLHQSLVVLGLLGAGSCRLQVEVHLPVVRADGQPIGTSRIYVSTLESCEPSGAPIVAQAAPPPTPTTKDTVHVKTEDPAQPIVTLFGGGSRCWIHATVWNDTNDNGKVDGGDAIGSLPAALEVEDRGLGWCGGTPVEAATLSLTTVP